MTDLPNLKNAKRLCIDTETKDPNLLTTGPSIRTGGYMVGISVATDDAAWYFPFDHAQGNNLDKDQVMAWAADNFSTDCDKVFTNALYDLDYLQHSGVKVNGRIIDIQVAEPLIDENAFTGYSLDKLANKYLGVGKTDEELYEYCAMHFGGKAGRKQAGNIWRCPPEIVEPYAISDVELPLRIWDEQQKVLTEEDLWTVFDIETRLIPMLLAMRVRGVKVDTDKANFYIDSYGQDIITYQNQLNEIGGFEVNVDANADLVKVFDNLGLEYGRTPPSKTHPKGQPSFAADFMKTVDHPIAQTIKDLKHKTKMVNTFIKGYVMDYVVDGRIHCMFNQLRGDEYGTVSGRFSSSNPNLQNIPSEKDMRSLYMADEGHDWWKLDYSSVEYRIACHYGKGDSAVEVRRQYAENPELDFHQVVADIMGIARKPAKNINFGMIYGMGIAKLAKDLGVTELEARRLKKKYVRMVPFMQDLMDRASKSAQKNGYVKTLSGRRRRYEKWEPRKWGKFSPLSYDEAKEKWGPGIKRAFTYVAVNSICQGGSADITKKAMVDVWESGVCDVVGVPLLTVHDELDFSSPRTPEVLEAMREVKHIMEQAFQLRVPILVDAERGSNWGDIEDFKL